MRYPLFTGTPLQHGLALIGDRLLDTAANLPAHSWKRDEDGNAPDVAANLLGSVALILPVFDWESQTKTLREKPAAVNEYVPRYHRTITTMVPGFELTISVPYTGSRLLMTSTPTERFIGGLDTRARVEPRERDGRLDFIITGRHIDHEQVATDLAKLREGVDRYGGFISDDVTRWQTQLSSSLGYEVEQRRAYWWSFFTIATTDWVSAR